MNIQRADPLNPYQFHEVQLGLVDQLFVKKERESRGFYQKMFDEDFARIFNTVSSNSDEILCINSTDDSLIEKLLANIKPRYHTRSKDETVRRLVEEIAQSLIRFGTAYHYLYDDSEQNQIHIVSINAVNVLHFLGFYFQWVPKRTEKHWDRKDEQLPRELRLLNANKLLHFSMPAPINRVLAAQNKTLAVLDKHRFELNDFHTQSSYENPNPTSYFDYNIWNQNQERALFRATRSTGWNARNTSAVKCSDFFHCHRLIRFRRNQLILRDDILQQLSCELSRVGKGYNSDFMVQIATADNALNIAHLNKLEDQLHREEVGFTEVIDYCYEQ